MTLHHVVVGFGRKGTVEPGRKSIADMIMPGIPVRDLRILFYCVATAMLPVEALTTGMSAKAQNPGTEARNHVPPSASGAARETESWQVFKGSESHANFDAYLNHLLGRTNLRPARQIYEDPSMPQYVVSRLDKTLWLKNAGRANVRRAPTTKSAVIGQAKSRSRLFVTGKVEGSNWYRVVLAVGETGFIRGELLTAREPAPVIATPPRASPTLIVTPATPPAPVSRTPGQGDLSAR